MTKVSLDKMLGTEFVENNLVGLTGISKDYFSNQNLNKNFVLIILFR